MADDVPGDFGDYLGSGEWRQPDGNKWLTG